MTTDTKEQLMKEIVDDALGNMADWRKPTSEASIGPEFPELVQSYCDDIEALKHEIREMLAKHSPTKLINTFQKNNYHGKKLLRDPEGTSFLLVNKIQLLKDREPAWFMAGWHVKQLELDTSHWRAFSRCTLVELTLLSIGLDPRKVAYDSLFERYGHLPAQDKMLQFVEDQFEAIANGLGVDPDDQSAGVDLMDFFLWVKKVKFKIDARFRTLLRETFGNGPDSTANVT